MLYKGVYGFLISYLKLQATGSFDVGKFTRLVQFLVVGGDFMACQHAAQWGGNVPSGGH